MAVVTISSDFGFEARFEEEREVDALARATVALNEEYARRKGPDDPAREIRESDDSVVRGAGAGSSGDPAETDRG